MKGAVFVGDRKVELWDFPDPTPEAGDAIIEIKASGMCGSDLKFYRAAPGEAQRALGLGDTDPVIAGHEPCGVVAAVGPEVDPRIASVGMRVMDHHYSGCGVCGHCQVGWSQLCQDHFTVYGVTGNGAHAAYMKVPARTLVPLPEEISFAAGAAIACGTGTAYGALRRLNISGRDTIAIFGQGPVGLSATQLAVAMGARVIALDIAESRRQIAEKFGARDLLDPSDGNVIDAIRDLTDGQGVDLALDCSGVAEARLQAVRATRVWGSVCYVGEGGQVTFDVSPDLLRKQITLIGSWSFSSHIQAECARFVAERGIAVDQLFTHRFSLDQATEAYALFDQQTMGKGVIEF